MTCYLKIAYYNFLIRYITISYDARVAMTPMRSCTNYANTGIYMYMLYVCSNQMAACVHKYMCVSIYKYIHIHSGGMYILIYKYMLLFTYTYNQQYKIDREMFIQKPACLAII